MRTPDLRIDGWTLDNAEDRAVLYPDTFLIPDRGIRVALLPGDYAKLIFRIALENGEAAERMWVVVRKVMGDRYMGLLENTPTQIAENEDLWLGVELPFGPEHIVAVQQGDADSLKLSARAPLKYWPRADPCED